MTTKTDLIDIIEDMFLPVATIKEMRHSVLILALDLPREKVVLEKQYAWQFEHAAELALAVLRELRQGEITLFRGQLQRAIKDGDTQHNLVDGAAKVLCCRLKAIGLYCSRRRSKSIVEVALQGDKSLLVGLVAP